MSGSLRSPAPGLDGYAKGDIYFYMGMQGALINIVRKKARDKYSDTCTHAKVLCSRRSHSLT